MSAVDVIRRGRAFEQQSMIDACTIDRPLGEPLFDEASDGYVTPATELYFGPCKVKPRDNADRVVEAAGETVSLWPYVVSVPMSMATADVDDVVTVTACVLDPSMVGKTLRVRQVLAGSFVTARRLSCELEES